MLIKFLSCLFILFSSAAQAIDLISDYKGFVDVGSKVLYVDYAAPQKGQPTIILLNGLTYTTEQWGLLTKSLVKKGFGVLRYDMDGMGQTLLKYGYPNQPIAYMDQVNDLNTLLKTLKMQAPYNLAGLSYGGGIAAVYAARFPKKINNLILMAPYTEALEKQDEWIKSQVKMTRMQYPYNPYSDDALYDYFLRQICYTTYPIVEPVVLENQYKLEAVFRLTQGIRKLKLSDEIVSLPKNSTFLFIAEKDQYIPRPVLEKFWNEIPETAKVEKIYIKNSEHKIPEAQPEQAAKAISKILSRAK